MSEHYLISLGFCVGHFLTKTNQEHDTKLRERVNSFIQDYFNKTFSHRGPITINQIIDKYLTDYKQLKDRFEIRNKVVVLNPMDPVSIWEATNDPDMIPIME